MIQSNTPLIIQADIFELSRPRENQILKNELKYGFVAFLNQAGWEQEVRKAEVDVNNGDGI